VTVLVVLGLAAAVAIVLVGIKLVGITVGSGSTEPLDTERSERWLIAHAPNSIRPLLRRVDRRVAGGVLAAAAFVSVLVGAMLVGWLFDSIDSNHGFARWDRSAAQWGADHATSRATAAMKWLTNFGTTWVVWVVMAVVGLAMVRRRGWGPLGYLALVGVGTLALNNLLKWVVGRPRPDVQQLVHPSGSSFPSGHSAAAAACWAAIMLVLFARESTKWRLFGAALAAAIAVMVATSRVLLGVHWLTDVIAGVAVGWTWFLLCTVVFGGRLLRFGEPAERVARQRGPAAPSP